MTKCNARSRWASRLCGLLLIVFAFSWALPNAAHAAPAGAHGPVVATFYTTTKAAYDQWPKTHYAAPQKVTKFSASTTTVAFYFTFKGVTPKKDHFQIVIKKGHKVFYTSNAYALTNPSGGEMYYHTETGNKPFPKGVYHATVRMDGKPVRTVTFRVGK